MPTEPVVIQPRRLQPLKLLLVLAVLVLFTVVATRRYHRAGGSAPVTGVNGLTMGTSYSLRWVAPDRSPRQVAEVKAAVEAALSEVNREMSTYDPESEISRFNAAPPGRDVPVSPGFARVTRFALELARRSGGAFDPTVGPLVELWGFGRAGRRTEPPTEAEIAAVRPRIGYGHVTVTEAGALRKDAPGVALDLSAVAKGYGVDAVARTLAEHGITNYLVEVGGEVFANGRNGQGGPWRVGVDRPEPDELPGADLEGVLQVSGKAVATSGNYRNFFKSAEGVAYAHIFDPRTGEPVRRPAMGDSVVAPDCLSADGLATALFVMGPRQGLAWLREHYPEAEALFVWQEEDGAFRETSTPGFAAVTGYAPRPAGPNPSR